MPRSGSPRYLIAFTVASSLFLLLLAALYLNFGRQTESARVEYNSLLDQGPHDEDATAISTQKRLGMQRDLEYKRGEETLHFYLKSDEAELILDKNEHGMHALEIMTGVECRLQEKVGIDDGQYEQVVVVMHATKASYDHEAEILLADDVDLKRYLLSGDRIPTDFSDQTPAAEGKAESVKIFLSDGGPLLTAAKLTGAMDRYSMVSNQGVYQGDELALSGEVVVSNNGVFTANSNHALYTPASKASGGMGIMYGNAVVKMVEGGQIDAADIHLDVDQEVLSFNQAKGVIPDKSGDINFTAKRLVWDQTKNLLTLSGDVHVIHVGYGDFTAAEKVTINLELVDGKRHLTLLETDGEVTLKRTDPETFLEHSLKSYGAFKIDNIKMEVRLLSPLDDKGVVIEDLQTVYSDVKGKIFSDRAYLKYTHDAGINGSEGHIYPSRIVLQGNVKFTNTIEGASTSDSATKQYILADSMELIPKTKEMTLRGTAKQRVLLLDETNHLQISAPLLKMKRDQVLRKEMVKALGDVRFSFQSSELDQLRSRFAIHKGVE